MGNKKLMEKSRAYRLKAFAFRTLYPLYFLHCKLNKIDCGNSGKVNINRNTHLLLVGNSKIRVRDGTFNIGKDFSYFGGSGIDPRRDNCRIHLRNSKLTIFGNVSIRVGCTIIAYDSDITIKNGTAINTSTYIISKNAGIEIGENCVVAKSAVIRDSDGHRIFKEKKEITQSKKIVIKDHCWIGEGTKIMKGVSIGSGCIVAAGAIVTKNVPDGSMVAGIPAKVIEKNIEWVR